MPRVAFATCAALATLDPDDLLGVRELDRLGVHVEPAVWRDASVDWSRFDLVCLRSCWDYHEAPDDFVRWIESLEAGGMRVWNPPAVLRWNLDKAHLVELAAAGFPVVPTRLVPAGSSVSLSTVLASSGWEHAVVKPTISLSAFDTWRTSRAHAPAKESAFRELVERGGVLVQRFQPEILDPGEWSFVFLGGRLSHAVEKRPASGDFRVQSEHGGSIRRIEPSARTIEEAAALLAAAPGPHLYARVDVVPVDGQLVLMELELIDPSLFLSRAEDAPRRLAELIAEAL